MEEEYTIGEILNLSKQRDSDKTLIGVIEKFGSRWSFHVQPEKGVISCWLEDLSHGKDNT